MMELAKSRGGSCLSEIYTNARTKLLWECQIGHRWETTPDTILRGSWCPYCSRNYVSKENCLQTVHPELAKQWHPTKNKELTPKDVHAGSNKKAWWRCGKGHEWKSRIMHRSRRGVGCPYCSGRLASKENCLQAKNPALAKEWVQSKNGKLTPDDVSPFSNKKAWWRCSRGHEWKTAITDRSKGSGCPYCSGLLASKENCLQTVNPKIAKQWHPVKNKDLTPKDVTAGSDKKAWWRCSKGHEWETIIGSRRKGSGCPYCAGVRKIESTPLKRFSLNRYSAALSVSS